MIIKLTRRDELLPLRRDDEGDPDEPLHMLPAFLFFALLGGIKAGRLRSLTVDWNV